MARGSISTRVRKDGVPIHYIRYRTADGTMVKKAIGPSRREAERALTEALAAVQRGELRTVSQERFDQYADRWLAAKRPRVEASTYRDYETHLRLRLKPAFGTLKLR